jgi:hypothetical protein
MLLGKLAGSPLFSETSRKQYNATSYTNDYKFLPFNFQTKEKPKVELGSAYMI